MAQLPKTKRVKRPTVLIKRTHCVRNSKRKIYPPLYQKLKYNNNSLARALSQEKQESQSLLSKNVELLGEVQNYVLACSARDNVISSILKNSKGMLQMIVSMSEILTNTIAACQQFNANQTSRSSASSIGRRESGQRMSNKSPARGVVKPMVSGHTITKPTINLSRVNLNVQRLHNGNLSIIDESMNTSERSMNISTQQEETRTHTRVLPERIPLATLRNEENEEVLSIRNSNRYSRSPRRISKRNVRRLSNRQSDQQIKNACVPLQDVSRIMRNSQSVNVRSLPENANNSNGNLSDSSARVDSEDQTLTPMTSQNQPNSEQSESDSEDASKTKTVPSSSNHRTNLDLSRPGPSWLADDCDMDVEQESFLNSYRKKKVDFAIPKLPKTSKSPSSPSSKSSLNDSHESANEDEFASAVSGSESDSAQVIQNIQNEEDDERAIDFGSFITRRRGGTSIKDASIQDDSDDGEESEDYTLMLNIKKQIGGNGVPKPVPPPKHYNFETADLEQMTPFKALRDIQLPNQDQSPNNHIDHQEQTATIQLTQRVPIVQPGEPTITPFSQKSTLKLSAIKKVQDRNQQSLAGNTVALTPTNQWTTVMLPRISDGQSLLELSLQQSRESPELMQNSTRRRKVQKNLEEKYAMDDVDENVDETGKKTKGRKKNPRSKDPSLAKVVLTKLNNGYSQGDANESNLSTKTCTSGKVDPSSDSENSNSAILKRPRRQKAPKCLQEPTLNKKLRRDE